MEILDHSSNHLILQDSGERMWMSKFISGIFLIWGFGDLLMGMIDNSFFSLIIVIHIVFLLSMGWATAWFPCQNTVFFDKELGKLTIKGNSGFRIKTVEYPLNAITDVIVEQNYGSEGNYYELVVNIASNSQRINLSKITFIDLNKIERLANTIRTFLSTP